jgi:hypothetical protein
MESRIRELESELLSENRRMSTAVKSIHTSGRRINELTFAADEGRRNQNRMQVTQAQGDQIG